MRCISRFLRLVLAAIVTAVIAPSAASAATLNLSSPTSDPTEQQQLQVTASGSTEAARTLYVFVRPGTGACSETAQAEGSKSSATEITGMYSYYVDGDAVTPTTYSRTHSYTPESSGAYRVCSYLAASPGATPVVSSTETLAVRRATATAGIDVVTADPVEQRPFSVRADGTTENDRTLFVFVHTNGGSSTCADTASAEDAKSNSTEITGTYSYYLDGDAIAAGQYGRTDSYTPTDAGTYRVCAYVHRDSSSDPYAVATKTVTVRRAVADASAVVTTSDPVEQRPFSVRAEGTTENDRTLFVFVHTNGASSSCAETASAEDAKSNSTEITGTYSYYLDGDAVAAGVYSRTDSYTPEDAGTYRVCAYVQRDASSDPYATASTTVVVRRSSASAVVAYADGVVTATGTTENDRTLFVFARTGNNSGACAPNASTEDARSDSTELSGRYSYYLDGDAISAGSFTKTYQATSPASLCAYLQRGASTDPYAKSQWAAPIPPAAPGTSGGGAVLTPTRNDDDDESVPELVAPAAGSQDDYGRNHFRWRGNRGTDSLLIYDEQPEEGTKSLLNLGPVTSSRDEMFSAAEDGSGNWRLTLTENLAPGRYWWAVRRVARSGRRITSVPRAFTIAAPRLTRVDVDRLLRPGKKSRKPGFTRLVVRAVPYSKVLVRVTRAGRTVSTKRYSTTADPRRVLTYRWSCNQTGSYKFVVRATDGAGKTKTASGSWNVSAQRCASMRAKERRAAERKRRRREHRNNQGSGGGGHSNGGGGNSGGGGGSGGSGGGGGGCDGDPGATPYPQFPGQRDGDHDGCYGET